MFLRNTLLFTFVLQASFLLADSIPQDMAVSAPVRLEQRTTFGGRLARGEVRISPVAAAKNANAKLTIEGQTPQGWSVPTPDWDSRSLPDGWRSAILNEGETTVSAELAVFNRMDVDIHGGVLEADETWGADKLHIVQYWVRIPKGRTLTVANGAIVKFCRLTGLQVDGTLNAENAMFTSIADDSAGGDTDMNGTSEAVISGSYDILGEGTVNLKNCMVSYVAAHDQVIDTLIQVQMSLMTGWNLITPPLELNGTSLESLMAYGPMVMDAVGMAYTAASRDDVKPGQALWLWSDASVELTLEGKPVADWSFAPSAGWSFAGAVRDVPAAEWPEGVTDVWCWTASGYRRVTGGLKAGSAYWIFMAEK